jgi:alkylation response protein AidB-like acyl-CoA dehydrogenase
MGTPLFEHEHVLFRESFRAFVTRDIAPNAASWDEAGIVPRDLFTSAGAHGFLAMAAPEEFGGAGVDDFRFNAVIDQELAYGGVTAAGLGITLHNDVCLPYFLELANDEQRERWLPGLVSGELISAIAMTEPGVGSDLAGMQTRAHRSDEGYRLSGTKTFITNGINADLVIVAARTDPDSRHRGLSLFVVERGMKGFERGRNLEKVGQHAQDTAEMFFDDVAVPGANLLGDEGMGFAYLVRNLAQERMSLAVSSQAGAQAALDWTLEYVKERRAFGRPIGTFQNSRFVLAECKTEVEVTRAFVDRCLAKLVDGVLAPEEAAMAKWWATDVQGRVLDRCLQLFGGYGYMTEYPIARAWADARVMRIFGGTNEIMKEIIGRSMGLAE